MRYALLIYENPGAHEGKSPAERQAITAEYMAMYDDGRVKSGAHLKPVETATVVRDDLVTDGPFADTKEIFGGFFLIEADDLDGALEIAKRIPAQRFGGAVEVRPIVEYER
ncbi:YciI family protein [Solirubrobacter phytolaccae]|uniref:YciI family protein n=1 Tax=Solirubrobacter phytolaccae TaxID=1404360 RepID=A0A9X3S9Y5_9ACTN|nr:YciI family protein [Solirubrobacter phytolaccae]MDA0182016.1 YciI family protein [Solirubrobacter phytolaccae]